ncbi:MAG: hypothetical protein ACJ73S_10385 [Mycobacteriales bacterium]
MIVIALAAAAVVLGAPTAASATMGHVDHAGIGGGSTAPAAIVGGGGGSAAAPAGISGGGR